MNVPEQHQNDPRGLIRESYLIEGISAQECRSILFDWALDLADDARSTDHIRTLHEHYGIADPDHPMTAVLAEGLASEAQAKRRGGRRGRVG